MIRNAKQIVARGVQKVVKTSGSAENADDAARIAELFKRVSRAMMAPPPLKYKPFAFDLTMAQGRCLFAIKRRQSCTLRELSDELGVRPSTASALVDKLVREGIVQREDDPNDRRAVRLRLAPKGSRHFVKHEAARHAHLQTFLDHLSAEQRRAMIAALETLDAVVQQSESKNRN